MDDIQNIQITVLPEEDQITSNNEVNQKEFDSTEDMKINLERFNFLNYLNYKYF